MLTSRELRPDLLDGAPPQVAGVGQHVVLVHEGEVPARSACRPGEGVAHDPLDAERGVDADLGRDLVRGPDPQGPAVADVGALGALADDDEVDAARRHARHVEGAGRARVEPRRAQVDVVVEGEAQRQQHAALEHAARHARVADGAEQDGVVAPQLLEHRVGQGLAGRVPAPGAEVVLGGVHLGPALRRHRGEDLEPLGNDLRADAVAADDGDVEGVLLAGGGRSARVSHGSHPTECLAL